MLFTPNNHIDSALLCNVASSPQKESKISKMGIEPPELTPRPVGVRGVGGDPPGSMASSRQQKQYSMSTYRDGKQQHGSHPTNTNSSGEARGIGVLPISSRDDDNTTSAHHATHYRTSSRLGSSDINSKLEALTAKSLALRAMSPPSQRSVPASYHPTTNTPSTATSPPLPTYNKNTPTSSSNAAYRSSSNGSVDSRLEYLTGMSRAMRESSSVVKGSSSSASGLKAITSLSSPTSVANHFLQTPTAMIPQDKSTFYNSSSQQHVVTGGEMRSWGSEDRTVVGSIINNKNYNSSNNYVYEAPPPQPSNTVDTDTSTVITTTSKAGKMNPPANRSLAMKVLCSKIMTGYTMSRNHCPDCTMALLYMRTTGYEQLDPSSSSQELFCAYCPFEKLRLVIYEVVAKQVATVLGGGGVRDANYNMTVCTISDEACIEIAREQGRGGTINDHRRCVECRIPKIFREDGSSRCVVCDVLREKLTIMIPVPSTLSSTAKERNDTFVPYIPTLFEDGSVPPSITNSPSIKSSGQSECPSVHHSKAIKEDFSSLQDRIQVERDKVSALQESIMNATQGLYSQAQEYHNLPTSNTDQKLEEMSAKAENVIDTQQENSPDSALTDSAGLPINLSKLQVKLNKVITRLDKCDAFPDMTDNVPPNDLAKLQSQLKAELAKAKESRAALELTLKSSQVNSSDNSIDELMTELDKVKQDQITLESIIQGTNLIEKATSDDPGLASSVTDELLAASRNNHSYSISQQEVDATGNIKEYIPPPTYFFQANIPSEITVYHIPEVTDPSVAPSVAAQSHHTQNLKRSERNPTLTSIHCCFFGIPTSPKVQPAQVNDNYDCETIETDGDYTTEYTLNTMDDSRLIQCQGVPLDEEEQGGEKKDNHSGKPKAQRGRFFFSCFDFGAEDDTYSMVERSERGIRINEQNLPPHHQYNMVASSDEQQWGGGGASSAYPNNSHYDPPGDTDTPNTPVESVGSMNRLAREAVTKRNAFVASTGREVIPKQTNFKPLINNNNNYGNNGPPAVLRVGGVRSPSPLSDWDNVSDFGSINRVHVSPNNTPQPKSILRLSSTPRTSDHYSVQSDLTDFSSINRKVKFGSSLHIDGRVEAFGTSRRGTRVDQQKHLRALTEESGSM